MSRTERILAAVTLGLLASSVFAADLAPRRDISPLDRAKVLNVESKRWLGYGATGRTTDTTIQPSAVGTRVCTTNVGVPPQATTPAGQYGPRPNQYGPGNNGDNIVVVSGDVISVCK